MARWCCTWPPRRARAGRSRSCAMATGSNSTARRAHCAWISATKPSSRGWTNGPRISIRYPPIAAATASSTSSTCSRPTRAAISTFWWGVAGRMCRVIRIDMTSGGARGRAFWRGRGLLFLPKFNVQLALIQYSPTFGFLIV
ncbi:hypothetical protein PUN4_520049 [Paraburkholderia unamae]|nr:hypothetical protein PUN4_520049 [Paraburkholderia unamae]